MIRKKAIRKEKQKVMERNCKKNKGIKGIKRNKKEVNRKKGIKDKPNVKRITEKMNV